MESHPTPTTDDMAVEPNEVNESAAERQEAGSEVQPEDADLESPKKKRKVYCKIICTLMCMLSIVPNMYRVSHSACVSERVFPTYYKTGDSPFRKKMESLPVAPVTPKSLPRHSRGTPEQLPSSFRAAAELAAARRAREPFFGHVSKITKIRVRTRDPEQSARGVTTRQPCWACNKWCTKDAYKHPRTHGRSGKPSVPPKTKVVELVEHNSTMQSPHARTDGNPPIIPRQIRRSASLPADSQLV